MIYHPGRCTPDHNFFNASKARLSQVKIILRSRPKNSEVDPRYYGQVPTVSHSYKRILNQPTLCSQYERVFLLYLIRTYYKHFDRRQVLRDILKQPYFANHSIVIEHMFLFGRTNNKTIEESIRRESDLYKDVIQEDFMESYINVSLKAIMAWKWSVEFCPNVENVFVMNDELFVDQNKLVKNLLKNKVGGHITDGFRLCYFKAKGRSGRFAEDRHMDPKYMYKGKFFPKHCHGVGYVAPIEVINKLYLASLTNPPMMPTDVWIGILAEKLNLKLPNNCSLFVIRKIRRYFENAKYLRLRAFIAITDEEFRKDHVAREQRHLFDIVQRHWQTLQKTMVIRHRLTTIISPLPNSKKTLNSRQMRLNTTVSIFSYLKRKPPDLPDQLISKSTFFKHIIIITVLLLIFLVKRKCIFRYIFLVPTFRLVVMTK